MSEWSREVREVAVGVREGENEKRGVDSASPQTRVALHAFQRRL